MEGTHCHCEYWLLAALFGILSFAVPHWLNLRLASMSEFGDKHGPQVRFGKIPSGRFLRQTVGGTENESKALASPKLDDPRVLWDS